MHLHALLPTAALLWTTLLNPIPALAADDTPNQQQQQQQQQPLAAITPTKAPPQTQYRVGDAIPVSCLNRSIETGEHITDEHDQLQYIPFPTCNETGRPLELYFGVERDINCTIDFIDDAFFHLLEFYVHNDAPMTCRIPSRPLSPTNKRNSLSTTSTSKDNNPPPLPQPDYIPLIVALTGLLQLSHLHVSNNLNILLHAAPRHLSPGLIDSATAYSTSHLTRNTKIVIGDSLPLHFSVRWYPTTALPSGWAGVGGHLYLTTLVYCLLSAGAATAVCVAYFRGVDLPKRLRSHGRDRAFTTGAGGLGGVRFGSASSGGYGYGVGNGYGYAGPGKID